MHLTSSSCPIQGDHKQMLKLAWRPDQYNQQQNYRDHGITEELLGGQQIAGYLGSW